MKTLKILILLFYSVSAFAQNNHNTCTLDSYTTVVYFVNGVWNKKKQAEDSALLLEKSYKAQLQAQYPNQKFEFRLAYNYHSGKVADVIELIGQKVNEINDLEVNKITASEYFNMYLTTKKIKELIPTSAYPLIDTIESYLAGRISNAVDSNAHIVKYRTDLQEGKRVLLIAHSQGNIFANQAIADLTNYSNNIGMIGIASPATILHSGTSYWSADDDRVINLLRITNSVLSANLDNDPGILNDSRDFSNHQFQESYFASGLLSRTKIDNDVSNNMANLSFPNAQLGNGEITVTLTWTTGAGVLLRVDEPNGGYVDDFNKSPDSSGYITSNSESGSDPVHYVTCAVQTPMYSNYSIEIEQYFGSTDGLSPTATVQISTNGTTRLFTKLLTDDSEVSVATIVVSTGENGKFNYEITEY